MSSPRLLVVAAMALASALLPASASAALSQEDFAPTPVDPSTGAPTTYTDSDGNIVPKWTADGIFAPGESVSVNFPLRDPTGQYQGSPTPTGDALLYRDGDSDFSVPSTAHYFPAASGGETASSTPWTLTAGSQFVCGTNVPLRLSLGSTNQTFNYGVPTGAAGAYRRTPSYDVDDVIYDSGTKLSNLPIERSALIKGLRVHIDQIQHQYSTYWLEIALISPTGDKVILMSQEGVTAQVGGSSANRVLKNVTFSETKVTGDSSLLNGGSPMSAHDAASDNFTNVVIRPQESFSQAFDGKQMNGNWKLSVRDISQPLTPRSGRGRSLSGQDMAEIGAWQLDLAGPVCSGTPEAWFGGGTPLVLNPNGDSLDASASRDPSIGGSVATYQWDLDGDTTNGPLRDGFETSSSSPTQPFAAITPGKAEDTRDIRLRVVDNQGNTSPIVTRTAIITQKPVISGVTSDPAQPKAGDTVHLTASATDVETATDKLAYTWDLNDDGIFDDGTGPSVTKVFTASGPQMARVKVTDGKGAFTIYNQRIAITNTPPVASAVVKSSPVIVGQQVIFDASASKDSDGTIVNYAWDLDGNGAFDDFAGTTPTAPYTFEDAGEHIVRLQVTDNTGGTDEIQMIVKVTGPPVADFAPSTTFPNIGDTVTFNAAGSHDSDADGSIVKYAWDLDGNGTYETSGPTTVSVSRSYPNAGNVNVRLQVTDNDGATGTKIVTILVKNPAAPGGTGGGGTGGGTKPPGGATTTPGTGGGTPGVGTPGVGPVSTGTPTQGTDPTELIGGGFIGGDPPSLAETATGYVAGINASAKQKAAKAVKNGVAVTLSTNMSTTITVKAMVLPKDAKKLGLKLKGKALVAIGSGKLTLKKSGKGKFIVKFSKKYQRYVKKATKLPVVLRGIAKNTDGESVAIARKVLISK